MRVFVTGADGQIARSIREAAAADAGFVVGCFARPEFDLARPETVWPAVEAFAPDLVVNCAAYTAVDKAEAEPEQAFAENARGAGAVADAAARCEVPIVQLSTDYVFDGTKTTPYQEDDPVAPTSVYGHSKLGGELAVAAANPRHIILRTAWVYAPFGANFVRTMLRLARERDTLRVVRDQVGCPTYAPDIAAGILHIARSVETAGWRAEYSGVTHLAGPDAMSWCEFAAEIVRRSASHGGRTVAVEAIATSEFPTAAKRPANSRLSTARLASVFGITLPPLEASLTDCLIRLES